jgi:antitoxin (DNA-binding transcriptional repressor) of toxin-antitoxin stability system
MEKVIAAAECKSAVLALTAGCARGRHHVVTSHGRPVATIVPVQPDEALREKAREILLARLRSQPAIDIGPWTRDELCDDEL